MSAKPNFFIVGAPKCGTTALYSYLDQHPDIFMPQKKEPHFFAPDMKSRGYIREIDDYYRLFEPVTNERCVGEASVFYLYSEVAAANIQAEIPSPKIIIMLRNPVDMIHSLHSQCLYSGQETITNFEQAIAAEMDRRRGKNWPRNEYENKLFYTAVADFAPQVERYFETFGRENVHVIIYDDFRSDLNRVFRDCLEFLEVEASFLPEFGVVNANKKVRNVQLRQFMNHPPPALRTLLRLVSPAAFRKAVGTAAQRLNTYSEPRDAMSAAVRERLQKQCRPSVKRLSQLLNRDLSHWCEASPARAVTSSVSETDTTTTAVSDSNSEASAA